MRQKPERNLTILTVALITFFVIRTYIASLSSFGFYHGWNEAHYSMIAENYFSHSLWHQSRGVGAPNFSVPPFFSYLVYLSFNIFGISDLSARLVPLLAMIFTVPFVYLLAKELYGKEIALLSSFVFILIPWNVLWAGRVQTDMVMTALMTASIALFVYAYNHDKSMIPFGICFGLAAFTKQPAFVVLVIVFFWAILSGKCIHVTKKVFLPVIIGLLPLFVWTSYHVLSGNISSVSHLFYGELVARTVLFSNVTRTIAAIVVGISPLILLASFYEVHSSKYERTNILLVWVLIYGIFALARTPPSHEYYILPLTPALAILASKGLIRFKYHVAPRLKNVPIKRNLGVLIILLVFVSTVPISYALLSYSGDLGYTGTRDVGIYLADYMNQNPGEEYLIIIPERLYPQMVWYMNSLSDSPDSQMYSSIDHISASYIEDITNNSSATAALLVVDGNMNVDETVLQNSPCLYRSSYTTDLPGLPTSMCSGDVGNKNFEQELVVFKLR